MNKRNLQIFLAFAAIGLMVLQLFQMNYSDLSWTENKSSYSSLISSALLLLILFVSKREKEKSQP